MSESEFQDRVLHELGELRGEQGMYGSGWVTCVGGRSTRLDALTTEVETLGRETRRELRELPAVVAAGVLAALDRSAHVRDLRALQAEVAKLRSPQGDVVLAPAVW